MEKLIGVFREIDGMEVEELGTLINDLEIIGSTSADVGNIELYYDNKGTTYAIAHDSEYYYGSRKQRENEKKYKFYDMQTEEFNKNFDDLDGILKMLLNGQCECDNKEYLVLDKEDNKMKCKNCVTLNNLENLAIEQKINLIKENEYIVYEIK